MVASLGCSLGSLVAGVPAPTATPTMGLVATFTATATSTATPTPTDTPVATDTPPATPTTPPPPTATATPPYVTYTVQAGDTLSSIASRFGVSVQAIMDANGLSGSIINIGMELTIPSSGSSVSPPPNPTSTQAGAAAPTSTRQPPTPTTPPPTATTQTYQYEYVAGSMQPYEKGCSDLGVQGLVLNAAGNPITGQVTVKWQLGGYVDYWVVNSDPIEQQGSFKFFIFPGPIYHGNKTSTIQIVESEANPKPLSEPLTWQVQDCIEGPELFANVIFRRR